MEGRVTPLWGRIMAVSLTGGWTTLGAALQGSCCYSWTLLEGWECVLSSQGGTNSAFSWALLALPLLTTPLFRVTGTGPEDYIAQHLLLVAILLHGPVGGITGGVEGGQGAKPSFLPSVSGDFSAAEGDSALSRYAPSQLMRNSFTHSARAYRDTQLNETQFLPLKSSQFRGVGQLVDNPTCCIFVWPTSWEYFLNL